MENKVGVVKADPSRHYPWVFLGFFVGVCLLLFLATGCFGLFAWGLGSLQERDAANGTATQEAMSALATATQEAILGDRANFGFIETFYDNSNDWFVSNFDDQYSRGEIKVADGLYTWDIAEVKQGFTSYGSINTTPLYLTDFDVYVDAIRNSGDPNGYCSGIGFRSQQVSTSYSYYTFLVCDAGLYSIHFHDGSKNEWLTLMSRETSKAIKTATWNTLGVQARGSHMKFLINGSIVPELDDTRLSAGAILLLVDVSSNQPGSLSFDNFAAQGR